jgi:hypothetical protein
MASEPPIQAGQVSSGYELVKQYRMAAQNKPILDNILGSTAQATGARPITNLKNPETAVKKVFKKNEENPKRDYSLKDVNDYARGRLVYPDTQAMDKGIEVFGDMARKAGAKVTKTTDYFSKPADGSKGFHVDIKFPNGQTSEVQFHTDQSYANALATHPDHAQFGDEKPAQAAARDKKTAGAINDLPNQLAQAISGQIEQQEAPAIQQGQQQAARAAQLGGQIGL